jgi:nucleoside-diphosphate-sugar epimerase
MSGAAPVSAGSDPSATYAAALAQLRERPRRWLVTGSAGFIGSHLVETLLRLSQDVVSHVAKELGVEYSVVWQSCKKDKSDEDRLADAITALEKFVDKVEDKEAYTAAVEALKLVAKIKVEEEKPADSADNKEANVEGNEENNTATEA